MAPLSSFTYRQSPSYTNKNDPHLFLALMLACDLVFSQQISFNAVSESSELDQSPVSSEITPLFMWSCFKFYSV